VGATVACGLGLIAFTTTGGVDLAPNTWAEVALTLIGATLAVAVLLWSLPGRAWGALTVGLFAMVTVLTALSIAWSVQPENSWLEANRTLSYLAVFGGAVALARLMPERWRGLLQGIAALTGVVGCYALLVKVFPGSLDPGELLGRLRAPFDYWNATGLIAALGLPAWLWAGSRREQGLALRVLSVPAIAVLMTVVVLSYSRSALLAAILGIGCWFALVPVRLRAAAVLMPGLGAGGVLTLWALATHPLTHDRVALASRTTAGHAFGLVLIVVLVLATLLGLAAAFVIDRAGLSAATRRRIGTALVSAVALIPLGGVAGLAASRRGLTGEVSYVWSTLTSPNQGVGDNPGRIIEVANSRPRYWSQGLKVGEHALLAGVGAAGYGTARTRYTSDPYRVQHAHSYVIETFADFGLIGLALNLALLISWGIAASRPVGVTLPGALRFRLNSPEQTAERAGMVTLLCVVLVFGVHSSIDWTWFVPGTALPALVCAGWLAGRGPLAYPARRLRRPRVISTRPRTIAAICSISLAAVLALWAIWQPLRSANADAAAIDALARGNPGVALADARSAAARDPVSVSPLWELSAIFNSLGNGRAAHAELVDAVILQPDNPATWRELGLYNLAHHQPQRALSSLEKAYTLDRSSRETMQAIAQARAEL
jgi:hypothetical protein